MTRHLLDANTISNTISNAIKPQPSVLLRSWMQVRRDKDLNSTPQTIAEIRQGILEPPNGRKRDGQETAVHR